MTKFKNPASGGKPEVDSEQLRAFATASETLQSAGLDTAASEARPVKEVSYNLGYRISQARLQQMERVLARCPGIKSKQALMDKIINAGLDRLDAQLTALPLQF